MGVFYSEKDLARYVPGLRPCFLVDLVDAVFDFTDLRTHGSAAMNVRERAIDGDDDN